MVKCAPKFLIINMQSASAELVFMLRLLDARVVHHMLLDPRPDPMGVYVMLPLRKVRVQQWVLREVLVSLMAMFRELYVRRPLELWLQPKGRST